SSFLPFRDAEAAKKARSVKKEDITKHWNPDFNIRVIEEKADFYKSFAEDFVGRIRQAREEGRKFVAILPVGPVPQYIEAAKIINAEGLSLDHLVTFNMDEYADENGRTAPAEWEGSFATAMWENLFERINPELRPKQENIHFPNSDNVNDYS